MQELQRCEHDGVSYKPQDAVAGVSVLPLTRPQLAEARRMRAAELFEQGRPSSEVARAVGMHPESVRRWKRLWEQGGVQALRRRSAPGRPPKLDDAQVEAVRTALEQGVQAHGRGGPAVDPALHRMTLAVKITPAWPNAECHETAGAILGLPPEHT
ncbi:helix-turn-helix domain-containing protein [Streptomyces longwoodensis]|uniref:helix-turn-helix domain-containing protein n=1 Tax=Streptomyces longwoodensis TaxID=68231 RepID=UPI0033DD5B6F